MTQHYATVYFDKGTEKEKSFAFDSFTESVASNNLNLSTRYVLGEEDMIPSFQDFKDLTFAAMEILDSEDNTIPYFGSYTRVEDISVNYYSPDSIYTVNVSLA